MSKLFKVLFAIAETSPLVKAGGLGDVGGSLPRALRRAGHDVRVAMPRYGMIRLEEYPIVWQKSFSMPFMGGREEVSIIQVVLNSSTPVYLIDNKRYFDRPAIYGEIDDLERFLLFCRAVTELTKMTDWHPDVIHCHDWHAAAVPALLKVAGSPAPCATVFTIHNLAYQGWFDDFFAGRAGLHQYLPPPEDPLRGKAYSMTGLGIYHSDIISTVSRTYAREILTSKYGVGLEELLQRRKNDLFGILNGIDYEQFDPNTDRIIAANYDVNNLDRRIANKLVLQAKVGLPVNGGIPLVGMAGRLVDQKGPDIVAQALESLLPEADFQFILQGTGETQYQKLLEKLENLHTRKARLFFVLDFSLAQLIFAGCDIFLMPSRFEPCGLAPLIAMRYGAIPVARRTGGLAETIEDCSADLSSGLGFVFENYNADELLAALRRALNAFHNKEGWRKLMVRAMQADFSWNASLPKYEFIYEMALGKASG